MGGVRLDTDQDLAGVLKDRKVWDRVVEVLKGGIMPPKNHPQPTATERATVLAWIQDAFANECDLTNPGRVTMRRMNRLEYNNTVRDLTGLDLHLADDFPSDDVGYGFDNIGDVLSISPLLMEKYLHSAEVISQKLILVPDSKPLVFDATKLILPKTATLAEDADLFSDGEVDAEYDCNRPGDHRIRVKAYADQAGPEFAKMDVLLDGKVLQSVEVSAVPGKAVLYEVPAFIGAGTHKVGAAFTNDYYDAKATPPDRNLHIVSIDLIRPPLKWADAPATHKAIIFEPPKSPADVGEAREIFKRFGLRAFRRPPTDTELDRLDDLAKMAWKNHESFERGIQLGVQAILSSPNFLFRVETDNGLATLNSYELATRLSYFLWSSMPDDTLLRLAKSGELQKPEVLRAQAKRMLADPKAKSLDDAFASQWLNLRKLNIVNPDPALYPEFNEKLRAAMLTETRTFFDHVVREDRPITDFLDAKYTYINEPLAQLYGIEGVTGDQFRRVSLEGTPRAGILTQAAVLTLTSNPTRTSPVKRGKWVLEQILNQPPPPPPPGVPDLKEAEKDAPEAKTVREKMARHLKDPVCASCHTRMDPIGLSLENFNGIGKWRTEDNGATIDASGELPDGAKFDGPVELQKTLDKKSPEFVRAFSEKMLTFAIGRGLETSDRCFVDEIAKQVGKQDNRFSAVVGAVVSSEPFRLRRPAKVKS